jgi:Actinobacteria/chloroflexi VLRF1 release factor
LTHVVRNSSFARSVNTIRQCVVKMAAGGNAKWLDVSAERFPVWVASFARRHGDSGSLSAAPVADAVAFTAADGAVAECHPPFPESFALPSGSASPDEIAALLAVHARAPRTVGVLLVRLGGYAAGVFTGYPPALADSKVGSRLVHGRSAAGGWSQQRFARRREKQANEALEAAADTAATVFGRWTSGITGIAGITARSAPAHHPADRDIGRGGVSRNRSGAKGTATGASAAADRGPQLDAVVLGGDKRAVAELRDDPRLAPYLALATERFLTVPDPKRAVLESTPRLFTTVRIRLTEPSM